MPLRTSLLRTRRPSMSAWPRSELRVFRYFCGQSKRSAYPRNAPLKIIAAPFKSAPLSGFSPLRPPRFSRLSGIHGTTAILAGHSPPSGTGHVHAVSTAAQVFHRTIPLRPLFRSGETRVLLKMGVFVWLQELGAIVFGQLDRILLGVSLGALAVAPYSLCIQFAQPIFGLNASGLHFLFPYLSGRSSTISSADLRWTVLKAFGCNLLLVACGAGILLLFGNRLIRLWAGAVVAQSATSILTPIILASSLMGLSVTGTYAMQALGRFREVALISLASRTVMLLPMIQLLHHMGLQGLAVSRLCYGSAALLVYLPLLRQLTAGNLEKGRTPSVPIPYSVQEEAKP